MKSLKVFICFALVLCFTGCNFLSPAPTGPEKIDVKATTYNDVMDLMEKYEDDIDFTGVTSGANCFTGTQTKKINSEKYGDVTVEFAYCKANSTYYMHVYN